MADTSVVPALPATPSGHPNPVVPPPTREVVLEDEQRAFLMVLRQALSMIVAYIERRYHLRRDCPHCGGPINKY